MNYIMSARLLLWYLGLGIFATGTSHSAEFARDVTVNSVFPIAESRAPQPGWQPITRIYVAGAPWGTSTCRQDAADLLHSEKNLLSVLLTGWALGKTINIGVDDARKSPDSVCHIYAIWVR